MTSKTVILYTMEVNHTLKNNKKREQRIYWSEKSKIVLKKRAFIIRVLLGQRVFLDGV